MVRPMNKVIIIFSHILTEEQTKELIKDYNISKFIELPEKLKYTWGSVDPNEDLEKQLLGIKDFLIKEKNTKEKTYVIVQGDFGATFHLVNFCLDNGFLPMYASSIRDYEFEKRDDGTIKNIHYFRHERFRLYKK